jgi:hypothetical protein
MRMHGPFTLLVINKNNEYLTVNSVALRLHLYLSLIKTRGIRKGKNWQSLLALPIYEK